MSLYRNINKRKKLEQVVLRKSQPYLQRHANMKAGFQTAKKIKPKENVNLKNKGERYALW